MSLTRRWSVGASAGPAVGVGSVDGVHAWRLRAAAQLDYGAANWLRLGVGVTGRAVFVNAPSGDVPSSRTGWIGGALLAARGVVPRGDVVLEGGPDLEVLAPRLSVAVGGASVVRLPTVIAGLSVDVSTP